MAKPTPLKIAIVSSGRTSTAIAAEAGMHQTHLSRIANGLHTDEPTQRKLADILGRTVEELFPDETEQAA